MNLQTDEQDPSEILNDKRVAPIATSCPESATETVIAAASGWRAINLGEVWRFRELLLFLIWRDIKVRYKQTLLGAAWAVLQPTMMMVVFTVFLGRIAGVSSGDIPYPVFVFAGLLPWTFFSTAITNAGNSVVNSEQLITKVYFPRLGIPFAAVGAALADMLIAFSVLAVMMAFYGLRPTWGLFWLPLVVALIALAALGVGTLLAALNVAYRDVRYVIPFLVQMWMFATPAIYRESAAPEDSGQLGWLSLNPMTGLIAFFRAATLGSPRALPWADLGVSAVLVVLLFVTGCYYFRRVEDSFADII
jgi:lipopolysaccharide transport system permease protein